MFEPLEEFSQQISRASDLAIMACLEKIIGTGYDIRKVKSELIENNDPTKQGTRYKIFYDGKQVGIIRDVVVVHENKAIGNVYIEMMEGKLKP